MSTSIITIPNGFAVKNENGSFVGFAATLKIAEKIKAGADANQLAVARDAQREKQRVIS